MNKELFAGLFIVVVLNISLWIVIWHNLSNEICDWQKESEYWKHRYSIKSDRVEFWMKKFFETKMKHREDVKLTREEILANEALRE